MYISVNLRLLVMMPFILPSEDLDAAEQRCEGAKKELESTLSELSDI